MNNLPFCAAARNTDVDFIDALQAEIQDAAQDIEYMEKR